MKHDMWTYLVLYSAKWNYLNDHCPKNEILAYMVKSLINSELVPRCPLMRNMICEPIWFYIRKNESVGMTLSRKWDFSLLSLDVHWCETWYVNLFGFIFGKMKVLEWLCRENEILASCPSMSLDAKHDMWTYLVLYSAKWNYLNDHCPKNEILAYMVKSLININVEFVPRCPLLRNIIFEQFRFKFGK
jgi:hypothetical protein